MDTRSLDRLSLFRNLPRPDAVPDETGWTQSPACLHAGVQVFRWEGLTLVIRGYLRPTGLTEPPDHERLAEELRWRYLEQGLLDLSELEGSSTVALFDSQTGEVHAVRTWGSPFPLYYCSEGETFLLHGSLPELVARARKPLAPDREAARSWIDQGELPDRQTLFEGVFRLLPGERIAFDQKGLRRFALEEAQPGLLTLARLDTIMRDCLGQLDRPACVLSARWSSVCLQIIRNRHLHEDELMPTSVSLAIDDPRAWAETDWVMTLSQRLGTGHLLIPAEQPTEAHIAKALVETLAATAEPPGSDRDLFLAPFAAGLRHHGLRSVLLDGGVEFLGQKLTHDQQLVRNVEHALTCLDRAGVEALCPFRDSRLPANAALGSTLLPLLPPPPRSVPLLTFWLRQGQPLADLAKQRRTHDLMTPRELDRARLRPTERLARLVCYDLWHRLFLEGDRFQDLIPSGTPER